MTFTHLYPMNIWSVFDPECGCFPSMTTVCVVRAPHFKSALWWSWWASPLVVSPRFHLHPWGWAGRCLLYEQHRGRTIMLGNCGVWCVCMCLVGRGFKVTYRSGKSIELRLFCSPVLSTDWVVDISSSLAEASFNQSFKRTHKGLLSAQLEIQIYNI